VLLVLLNQDCLLSTLTRMGETGNTFKISVGKRQGRRPLGRLIIDGSIIWTW